jgi:hypothetical protein
MPGKSPRTSIFELPDAFMAVSVALSAGIHFFRPLSDLRTSKPEMPSTSSIEKMEEVHARQLVGSRCRPIIAFKSVDLPALIVATTATEKIRGGLEFLARLLVLDSIFYKYSRNPLERQTGENASCHCRLHHAASFIGN